VVLPHARKVAGFSQTLFSRLEPLHQLPLAYGRLLEAAAYFCDTGHHINDSGHHKHAYYIVSNLDFSGFTNREPVFIATLCRYHRKAMPSAAHAEYQILAPDDKRALLLLIPVLRLADNLDRSRDQAVEIASCEVSSSDVTLKITSPREPDLAEWAAARVADVFRQVYGRGLGVTYQHP
jgi:exopolyphosphatase/guanosine-5'-triphosphate,3'-diphosphate pyrophosphatase